MKAIATTSLVAGAVAAASCTSDVAVSADALDCFGGDGRPPGATEEGQIELLESRGGYRAIEEDQDLALVEGRQRGYHFNVSARIKGLAPGDAEDTLAQQNPHTIFTVHTEDGGRIDNSICGWRLGYKADGEYDYLTRARRARLSDRVTEIAGERVMLSVEILDGEGRYARDDVWITATRDSEAVRPGVGVPDAASAPDAGASGARP